MDINKFKKTPVLGIIRGVTEESLEGTFQAAYEAGFYAIEITMNTPGAPDLIQKASKKFSNKLSIGAGTVTTLNELKTALRSGATFIVTPVYNKDIAQFCSDRAIPFFPGALTPTEIFSAWKSGATMIKVFPTFVFGPSYFSSIKGPFKNIKLMAVGGVSPANLSEYFSHGASAIATGSSVFKKEWMEKKDFKSIYNAGMAFIDGVRNLSAGGGSAFGGKL